ncbi:glycosyltransferase family 2 protein [Streptomyces sp. NBC_01373]|uniref:glycosyltransferase family 2 protein n=1 Tax=unclassified Streptomyces TaxID=2593676 RepID=UPI00224D9D9D|nr:glycosyltransferase family 2 protein [Streptomyces sp. NBC_01373]MCX4700012.1 glycosyltransferase [Streptomyces sp. NBC_01373]
MNSEPVPDVTVVVGAYEAMPYLVRCLESVETQTLGSDRIEIVAVDDGSSDGTGEYLEKFAALSQVPTRVIRQANSGGPSGPRNVGLESARGRYVFFLDADDYLGDEALERMVAMADRAGTDVVLGKMEGVDRGVARSMFGRTQERADVYTSRVIFTLSAQKLFRRELLVRLGLRFDEKLTTGEDALFTMEAYLRGNGVSVVADHVCYYLVRRDDGKHATRRGDYTARFAAVHALMDLIARLVPPGAERDQLMVRPFTIGLLQQFRAGLLKEPENEQRHKMELAAPMMTAYWTKGMADRIKVGERLILTCVAMGALDPLKNILEFVRARSVPEAVHHGRAGRLHLAYPHFRDRRTGIPDEAYEVTVPDWSGSRRVLPSSKLPQPAARRAVRKVRRHLRSLRTRG